jgi:hypothetical protein
MLIPEEMENRISCQHSFHGVQTWDTVRSASAAKVCRLLSGLYMRMRRTRAGEASGGRWFSSSLVSTSSNNPWYGRSDCKHLATSQTHDKLPGFTRVGQPNTSLGPNLIYRTPSGARYSVSFRRVVNFQDMNTV